MITNTIFPAQPKRQGEAELRSPVAYPPTGIPGSAHRVRMIRYVRLSCTPGPSTFRRARYRPWATRRRVSFVPSHEIS